MKFSLDGGGADSVVKGLSNAFMAAAMAPQIREQAMGKAALQDASAYAHNMSGNKSGAQAEQEQFTLDQRNGVDNLMSDPALKPYMKNMLQAFKLTGDTNADRVAKAGTEFQTQGLRDNAQGSMDDVDQMNKYISIAGNKAYEPFANIGTTGSVYNKATGDGKVASDVLNRLFGNKTNSEIGENNAQASNARASASQHNASTDKIRSEIGGVDGVPGKAPTTAQRKANEEVDAARAFLKDVPREAIATVMNKSEFDMTPQDKDLLARIKKARQAKFGESGVPAEFNEMLGMDRSIVDDLAGQLQNPKQSEGGVIAKLFGTKSKPMSEEEIIKSVTKNLPPAERAQISSYVAAAKAKTKNPATAQSGANMQNDLLEQARAAIVKGAPREKVIERLRQKGIDPAGL